MSREDLKLWQQVKRTVEPLQGRTDIDDELHRHSDILETENERVSARIPKTENLTGSTLAASQGRLFPAAPYSPPVSSPSKTVSGGGIDDKTAKKLLKGRLSIEDRIDLHGRTQAEAHRLLGGFLARSHASGKRIVLVITGKGRTTGGVLRQLVPQWLREPQLSPYISAFRSAHLTHGGDGALYVRLRRNHKKSGSQ
jgi:DNA-nicking Smr family endonuclease